MINMVMRLSLMAQEETQLEVSRVLGQVGFLIFLKICLEWEAILLEGQHLMALI